MYLTNLPIATNRLAKAASVAVLAAALAISQSASAQDYPSGPIELVTHSGVGGGTDIAARMAVIRFAKEFGAEANIVNKIGGSGAASFAYMNSKPRDGNTIMMLTQTHILTILRGAVPGMTVDDIVPIARATDDPQILMVAGKSPYNTAQEFIEAAKGKSMKFNAVIGATDHVALLSFAEATGLKDPVVVPFQGGGDVLVSLVAGDIDAIFMNYSEAESQIRAGDIRPLVVLSAERNPLIPDVPTGTENGIPVIQSTIRGFAVLKGTPEDRIKKIEDGLLASMKGPEFETYIKNTAQSQGSVAGRDVWQKQIADYTDVSREVLKQLQLLP